MNSNENIGVMNVYKNNYREGMAVSTKMDYFSKPFCAKDDKLKGRIIFTRPDFSSLKVKICNKHNGRYNFYLSNTDIKEGIYSDIEIENETLYLYYK